MALCARSFNDKAFSVIYIFCICIHLCSHKFKALCEYALSWLASIQSFGLSCAQGLVIEVCAGELNLIWLYFFLHLQEFLLDYWRHILKRFHGIKLVRMQNLSKLHGHWNSRKMTKLFLSEKSCAHESYLCKFKSHPTEIHASSVHYKLILLRINFVFTSLLCVRKN